VQNLSLPAFNYFATEVSRVLVEVIQELGERRCICYFLYHCFVTKAILSFTTDAVSCVVGLWVRWVVSYENDDSSSETYLYERESKTLSLLFQHHPQLNELLHVHLHFVPAKLQRVV
jgi:hypothetical protein